MNTGGSGNNYGGINSTNNQKKKKKFDKEDILKKLSKHRNILAY